MILIAPALCSLVCIVFIVMPMNGFINPRERRLRLSTVVLFLIICALWIATARLELAPATLAGAGVAGTLLSCGEVWLTWRITLRRYIDTGNPASHTPPPPKDPVDRGELSKKNIEQYFKISRPWLDPRFQLPDLANALGVNRSDLSAFINRTFEVNFKRYVNSWRLAEFERLMSLPSNEFKNPYRLAKMAGFTDFRHFRRVDEQEREQEHEHEHQTVELTI
jgi:AraC-like DNA-binding protein